MDAPLPFEKIKKYNKVTSDNQNYSLLIQIKNQCSIYISILFEDYSIEEIYDEIFDLISKNNIEFNKNNEQILFNIILPFKKRKILYFVLENKKFDKINDSIFHQIIKQKDETIKKYEEIIKQKDNIIKI